MPPLLTPIRNAYYLSFPVVLGAVLSNRMAARLSDVTPIHWATPIMLALVVFVIYTVDRLLDVRKPYNDALDRPMTARHQFHRRYAPLLWLIIVAAVVLGFGLTFLLPGSVIRFGIVLGGICAAYVGIVFRLPARHPVLLLKEPLVAVLYSVGVWGSVWVQRSAPVSYVEITEFMMFTGIAFQNLILFALMEQLEHPTHPEFSLATQWGPVRCHAILNWLTFLTVAAGLTLCFLTKDRFAQRSALMLGLMSLTLSVIQHNPDYFLKNERYRWLGDGIFWFPALVL